MTRKGYRSSINAPKFASTDPKRKPHRDDGDSDKRRRQEQALDEALENTFPASDPVSVEQPMASGAQLSFLPPFI